jgi:hypothetical protein
LAKLGTLADRLDGAKFATDGAEPGGPRALRVATLNGLEGRGGEPAADRSTLALVIAGEWAQNLARLEDDVEQPVKAAVAAARIPWWR